MSVVEKSNSSFWGLVQQRGPWKMTPQDVRNQKGGPTDRHDVTTVHPYVVKSDRPGVKMSKWAQRTVVTKPLDVNLRKPVPGYKFSQISILKGVNQPFKGLGTRGGPNGQDQGTQTSGNGSGGSPGAPASETPGLLNGTEDGSSEGSYQTASSGSQGQPTVANSGFMDELKTRLEKIQNSGFENDAMPALANSESSTPVVSSNNLSAFESELDGLKAQEEYDEIGRVQAFRNSTPKAPGYSPSLGAPPSPMINPRATQTGNFYATDDDLAARLRETLDAYNRGEIDTPMGSGLSTPVHNPASGYSTPRAHGFVRDANFRGPYDLKITIPPHLNYRSEGPSSTSKESSKSGSMMSGVSDKILASPIKPVKASPAEAVPTGTGKKRKVRKDSNSSNSSAEFKPGGAGSKRYKPGSKHGKGKK